MDQQYVVIIKREFFSGTYTDDSARPVESERGEALVFDSLAEAQDWIDEREEETYVLSHGEAGRPEYWIVPEEMDAQIEAIIQDGSLIDWEGCECRRGEPDKYNPEPYPCGNCDECNVWIKEKIEAALRAAKVEAAE